MNPPSALHGAMSRDRKPFTYTPGGLNLSEIKSERMAQRLMRNAMNEGVPEKPVQQMQSPPATNIAVPNFNCLPVQVFPSFNLPANPKSLLRTRSNPVSREPLQPLPSVVNNNSLAQYDTFNKNTPQINNNRPASMFECAGTPFMNYGSNNTTIPGNVGYGAALPEMCYDAQYFQVPKLINYENSAPLMKLDIDRNNNANQNLTESSITLKVDYPSNSLYAESEEIHKTAANQKKDLTINIKPEITPTPDIKVVPDTPVQEVVGDSDEQKQVKIVTKEAKKETKSEEQNGNQNGDIEAEMTVKLPSKTSSSKTNTKVEISKKTLPDGSIEEIKKTITTTTIDGKTEIKTKTETTIIPKDNEEEEEVEEEEEESSGVVVQEVEDEDEKKSVATDVKKEDQSSSQICENGKDNIIKTEERSETKTTSTKKVVIIEDNQNDEFEEEEEEEVEDEVEEIEKAEPVTVVLKKPSEPAPSPKQEPDLASKENEKEENVDETKEEKEKVVKQEIMLEQAKPQEVEVETITLEKSETKEQEKEEEEEEEEYEEAEEKEVQETKTESPKIAQKENDELSEYTDEEIKTEKDQILDKTSKTESLAEELQTAVEPESTEEIQASPVEVQIPITKETDEKQEVTVETTQEVKQEVEQEIKKENLETIEPKVPLREPSVPLEKVEDVEIKPIGAGNFITKSHTETTEIITGTGDKPTGLLTEFNRTENVVTVNRTTKTLDYEKPSQTIPTLTYFTPHIDKFPPPPQPASRPYQPVYQSEPVSERRHSLLLERLSMERQIPTSEIYQNTQQYNQSLEQQNQWPQEPRVEILNIENVKPSTITNQQWYQQSEKKDVIYNNMASAPPPVAQSWNQPKPQQQPAYQPPPQPAYQPPPQPTYQAPPQPAYQVPPQPVYQTQHQPKPGYQAPQPVYQAQPQYQTQPQYQPRPITPQPPTQYQSTYTETLQQNTSNQQDTYSSQQNYSTYTPKPTNWASSLDAPSINAQNQYSTDSYQSTQQRSSSYIPPPWEQDSTYAVNNSQNYYQPPPQTTFNPDNSQSWQPTPPASKFNKTTATAYIPPKPNQSFVKHVTVAETPRQPGRKTYYSEYERRYISVPESTYIPGESKLPPPSQPQPDPSPAYYYDNNDPAETVEHEWRKELREFTEKAQTQPPASVKPPWESETRTQTKYEKSQETTYTATPTWSQTLRPQSWRERSFESEFVSQEWPKTNTLGRGRPLSSYGKDSVIPERTRGVSVDRYNPNNYQSPVPEPHPPVQTFTHNPPAPRATGYHNPNVPAYHAHPHASAEPREQPVYQQPRARYDSRASPFQSRSFKYLQWITGTDD